MVYVPPFIAYYAFIVTLYALRSMRNNYMPMKIAQQVGKFRKCKIWGIYPAKILKID